MSTPVSLVKFFQDDPSRVSVEPDGLRGRVVRGLQHRQRRFRLGVYVYPPGWYSYSWRYGDFLPFGWYSTRYYLNDWWSYGLPMPPIGCEWVRVGDDAYLVDIWSGRVLSVYYDLFW